MTQQMCSCYLSKYKHYILNIYANCSTNYNSQFIETSQTSNCQSVDKYCIHCGILCIQWITIQLQEKYSLLL